MHLYYYNYKVYIMTINNNNDGIFCADDSDYDHSSHPTAFTEHMCNSCGAELRRFEYKQYEDTCHTCIQIETANLIEDNPYDELGE